MKMETTAWVDPLTDQPRWGLCEEGGGDMIAEIDSTREDQEGIANQIASRSLGLFEQIEASAKIENLDDAVRPIQDILGQDDGGLAAQFFDDLHQLEWPVMPENRRRYQLIRYTIYELGMLELGK